MTQLMQSFLLLLLLLPSFIHFSSSVEAFHDVTAFGAKSDGRTDSTKAFISAWTAACRSPNPATIHVPRGSFLIGPVTFHGPCRSSRITIQIDGTLVAPSKFANLRKLGQWMLFDHVNGVSVYGGTVDGHGSSLWACKVAGRNCPAGATSLAFRNSKNILITGLTSINSELYHIVIDSCQAVTVKGVRITAPGDSPNTDGIHVQSSTDVTITGTGIKTGDDCISIGPGTMNLWIEKVTCGPGHGISIGSLGKGYDEKGVENVTVKTAAFTGTENGLRIKTWGRPSEGFVKGVVFEHATMQNVRNPIIIDQNYCPDEKRCPGQNSGVKISEVKYMDVQGSSASQVAINFDCSASNPCSGIGLQDVKLTYGNKPARSSCQHVHGTASGSVVPSCF
ncbi:polygalacturonase-like [Phoenix dactylifera]|uniref:Exopolygalacturonase n=1 Tax=Phoenix dactylifera TaxID=42345 RepID=A0A8B7BYW8_PHODC|nr:polygalacturonase-like [Phoenix dactylifera]